MRKEEYKVSSATLSNASKFKADTTVSGQPRQGYRVAIMGSTNAWCFVLENREALITLYRGRPHPVLP